MFPNASNEINFFVVDTILFYLATMSVAMGCHIFHAVCCVGITERYPRNISRNICIPGTHLHKLNITIQRKY